MGNGRNDSWGDDEPLGDSMGPRDEGYDDEEESGRRCMFCPISTGMALSGVIMLGITVGHFIFLQSMTENLGEITFYVGALLKGSWSYVMWLTGIIAASVSASCISVYHPYGRLQMAWLNFFCSIVFMLSVIYNGFVSPLAARINQDTPDVTGLNSSMSKNFKKLVEMGYFALIGWIIVRYFGL